MLFWFVVLAVVGVALVFQSPGLDYRFVAVGAVLPLVDVMAGRVTPLHTLAGSVAVLVAVMAATAGRGKRLRRRQWLGIPIGMFAHLVLDGVWADTEVFWWPFAGWSLGEDVPETDRGLGLSLLMDAVAIVIAAWAAPRLGLRDRAARRTFVRTGRLPFSRK